MELNVKVRGFPKTTLPFDTYDIAYFPVNAPITAILEKLSGTADVQATLQEFFGDTTEKPPTIELPPGWRPEWKLPKKLRKKAEADRAMKAEAGE